MNTSAVIRGDNQLYIKGKRFFGSWGKALEAAGVDPEKIRRGLPPRPRYPSPESLSKEIQRRQREHLPLYSQGVAKGPHADVALLRHACRAFGSWDRALDAAGLDATKIRRRRPPRRLPASNG